MAGNAVGGKKAAMANKANDPSFYQKIGKLGGSARVPKGFAVMDKEKVRQAGRLGGSASRRGKGISPMQ